MIDPETKIALEKRGISYRFRYEQEIPHVIIYDAATGRPFYEHPGKGANGAPLSEAEALAAAIVASDGATRPASASQIRTEHAALSKQVSEKDAEIAALKAQLEGLTKTNATQAAAPVAKRDGTRS